jgi:hypothetical protein
MYIYLLIGYTKQSYTSYLLDIINLAQLDESARLRNFFLSAFISRKIIVFCLLYFFYIIIILLFHNLIEIRIASRIRVFGTRVASFATIVASNRSSRKSGSLMLFRDLLGT